MRTYSPKASELTRTWHVLDADGVVLGRLATEVARLLRGKHRPYFAPHLDTGDAVIVVNAAKVRMTANKAADKLAYRHSGYPGGLRSTTYATLLETRPELVIERAGPRHGPAHAARPRPDEEAVRLRRTRAPPRGAAARRPTTPRRCAGLRSTMPKPLTQTTGRRKEAVARVRLRPGTGVITVNARTFDQYFTSATHRMVVVEPLRLCNARPRPTTSTRRSTAAGSPARPARCASASRARSSSSTASCGRSLKKAGLLTRDAREKESKKYGLKKARKAPQYSKR